MARRRRKYKKQPLLRPIPRLPSVFECPNCGVQMVSVKKIKEERNELGQVKAVVRCGKCGLYGELWVPDIFQSVDIYHRFLDMYLEGELEVELIKKPEKISTEESNASSGGSLGEYWESGEGAKEEA